MKKLFILIACVLSLSYSFDLEVSASVIASPDRGALSVANYFGNKSISTNIHFSTVNASHLMLGAGIAYHFLGYNGPYAFHSSDWMISMGEEAHFWQLDFGLGYQYAFFKHFGVYVEVAYEFYAGNGGYYTLYNSEDGSLSNDGLYFPLGIGLLFPF
jgi:hypothetical protein